MNALTPVGGGATSGLRASYYLLPTTTTLLTQVNFDAPPSATGSVSSLNHYRTNAAFWEGGRADRFAAKYEGFLNVEKAGKYTFYLRHDDGAQLFVNGQRVVSDTGTLPAGSPDRVSTVSLNLTAGSHAIEIRYFEKTGLQSLRLEWAGPDTAGARRLLDGAHLTHEPVAPTPAPAPAPAAPAVPILSPTAPVQSAPASGAEPGKLGLKAEYFALSGSVRSLSAINFDASPVATAEVGQLNWARSNNPFWQGGPTDNFAARFTGDLVVEKGGRYTFYLRSDDGSQLFIDGRQVINNDGVHNNVEKTVTLTLSAGLHDIEVRYFDRTGAQTLQLDWRGPDTLNARSVISGKHLVHDAPAGGSTGGSTGGTTGGSTGGTAGGSTGGTSGGTTGGTGSSKWPGLKAEFVALPWSAKTLADVNWAAADPTKTGYIGALSWMRTNESFWKGAQADLFAARFTGDLNVVNAGRYTFYLTSDDGSALYIDGRLVINHDGGHETTERSVTLDLTRGAHRIEVRYFENYGEQSLRLEWMGPDSNNVRRVIDGPSFSHDGPINAG
ncbi:MAG: PA14 domain-containing protein, partial [Rhodobacteraceae bacterium]|nr:PA14 domain-containing protein [Paracoccaceae bacterium]